MAIITLPNEYAAQGFEGPVDCDGPLHVMIFAIPSYLVYGLSLIIFTILTFKSKSLKWSYLSVVIFCCLLVIAITPNVIAAFQEHNRIEHIETCGKGW